MNIYVGNLPYSVTEDELRAAFADFGEVTSANVIMDRMSGQSKRVQWPQYQGQSGTSAQ